MRGEEAPKSRRAQRRHARQVREARARLWKRLTVVGLVGLAVGWMVFTGTHRAFALVVFGNLLLSVFVAVHVDGKLPEKRHIEDRVAVVFMFGMWAVLVVVWVLYAVGVIK